MFGPRTVMQQFMWSLPENLKSPGISEVDRQSETRQ